MLEHDKLRSEGWVQEESCREGETEPDDKLDGEGGVGDVVPCCCHGTVPGGDRVTGTTFFTVTTRKPILKLLLHTDYLQSNYN